jgi:hypothetical protein
MWMQRNAFYHDLAHPWHQQKGVELCNRNRQEWSAYHAAIYFPEGRKYVSGHLDFLLRNYYAEAQCKWLASVVAARAQKAHITVNITHGERTVMLTWLHGWRGIISFYMTTCILHLQLLSIISFIFYMHHENYSCPLHVWFNRHWMRQRKSLP